MCLGSDTLDIMRNLTLVDMAAVCTCSASCRASSSYLTAANVSPVWGSDIGLPLPQLPLPAALLHCTA